MKIPWKEAFIRTKPLEKTGAPPSLSAKRDLPFISALQRRRIKRRSCNWQKRPDQADYHDVGQMNMSLGYFENEENTKGDNAPIGIVLAREKNELVVQYAMHNVSSQLFVQEYQLYLPNKEELRNLILKELLPKPLYEYKPYLIADKYLSKLMKWNICYHPKNKLQRIAPAEVFFVLLK